MASSSSLLSEDQLQCSICLDVFTDPVSTPCGHNFCMICLNMFWDSSSHCQCPICKEEFQKRPELRVNTFISGLAASFKESVQVKSSSSAEESSSKSLVLCEICTEDKHEALMSCLICKNLYCSTHLEPHQNVPGLKNHKLLDPETYLRDYVCQKHEKPLEMFCIDDEMCVCEFCTLDDHRNHNTVPVEEKSEEKKNNLKKTLSDVDLLIRQRKKKLVEIRYSVILNTRNSEKVKSESMEIFRALTKRIKMIRAELLTVLKEKQKAAERQAAEFMKDLEQEITELKRRKTELEQISHTEDHLHLLQMYPSLCRPPPTNDLTDVRINSNVCVEIQWGALSKLQMFIDEEMKKVDDIGQRRNRLYAVDVTLDPRSANPNLFVSSDRKQVQCGNKVKLLRNNAGRFDVYLYVTGTEGFSTGRHYYEVQVKGKTDWVLGIIRESSNRKGEITRSPEAGYWCVSLEDEMEYVVHDSPPVCRPMKKAPQRVGVFVDYEEGLISFYDVTNRFLIYSFIAQYFSRKIYPVFNPCDVDEGANSAPLIISPVHQIRF